MSLLIQRNEGARKNKRNVLLARSAPRARDFSATLNSWADTFLSYASQFAPFVSKMKPSTVGVSCV